MELQYTIHTVLYTVNIFVHGPNCFTQYAITICVHGNNYNMLQVFLFMDYNMYVHITLCLFQSPVLSMILAMWVTIMLA